jgi:histidyl-tRNA synthetase
MASEFQAPRGTSDLLPADSEAHERLVAAAATTLSRAGYGRIETPAFEDTELFSRGVGEATDIVRKEMFTFTDRGGRSLTLRPEGTAPICRAYVEHGMHRLPQPVKLWYAGPYFRHERPQAGRYRQFRQVGAEAIGSGSPLVDAELIILLEEWFRELEVPGLHLRLGSLGSPDTRADYRAELQDYLRAHEADLSEQVRDRIPENPLRAFDADDPGTREVMAGAPTMLDRLDEEDAKHFEAVRGLLDQAGIGYEVDGTLVRGLDYYTRTVFEFHCQQLGAQSQVGGGGRYDGLVEELGGPATPAAGWAVGVERILLALGAEGEAPRVDVFVAAPEGLRERALAIVIELRRAGISADLDLAGRAIKGQMKQADRSGARTALILDEEGAAQARDMDSGEQRPLDLSRAVEELGGDG